MQHCDRWLCWQDLEPDNAFSHNAALSLEALSWQVSGGNCQSIQQVQMLWQLPKKVDRETTHHTVSFIPQWLPFENENFFFSLNTYLSFYQKPMKSCKEKRNLNKALGGNRLSTAVKKELKGKALLFHGWCGKCCFMWCGTGTSL